MTRLILGDIAALASSLMRVSLAFLAVIGCSANSSTIVSSQPEPFKGTLGSIAIIAQEATTVDLQYQTPTKGIQEGIVQGAEHGVERGKKVGQSVGKGAFMVFSFPATHSSGADGKGVILIAIPLLLVGIAAYGTSVAAGMLIGGIEGGIRSGINAAEYAESLENLEANEAKLKEAVVSLRAQETMHEHVLRVAQEETRHHIVLSASDPSLTPKNPEDVSAVLKTEVLMFGLEAENGPTNFRMRLFMKVHVHFLPWAYGEDFLSAIRDERTIEYRSQTRTFSEWAASDAQLFRKELEACYQKLSREIVREFLIYPAPQ